jgi:hypothetical protein
MRVVRRLPVVTVVVVACWTAGGLLADQQVGRTGQLALGVFTAGVLLSLLALHPPAVRVQTLAVVGIATLGEVVGSIIWGVYSYRLENLPTFVPPGHGLVYLAGMSLAVLAARRPNVLLGVAITGATVWAVLGLTVLPSTDVSGAIGCTFLVVVLFVTRRPVYAGVFVVVAALEIYGTAVGTWTWQSAGSGTPNPAREPTERRREWIRRLRRRRAGAHCANSRCGSADSVEESAELASADDSAGRDELTRRVHLAPDVPEQESARLAVPVDVGHDALPVRFSPLGDRVQPRVDVSDRLVSELEQVRVEERKVVVRLACARHVRADNPPVGVRVVLVLDAPRAAERGNGEAGDVAGREHVVAATSSPELVDRRCRRRPRRRPLRRDPSSDDAQARRR